MNNFQDNIHGGDPASIAKQLGLPAAPEINIDFSVNINPIGPPESARRVLLQGISNISQYPETAAETAASVLASAHNVPDNYVLVGNGSTEILGLILLGLKPSRPAMIAPSYAGYSEACTAYGLKIKTVSTVTEDNNFQLDLSQVQPDDYDMLFLCSPNNPTGTITNRDDILSLAARHPDKHIVLDESFMDFVPDSARQSLIASEIPENLIIIKSLTKFFAVPGIRLGMAFAHPDTAHTLAATRLPWSVNSLAQELARKLYSDTEYIDKSISEVVRLRGLLSIGLSKLDGYTSYPSSSNFVLVKLPEAVSASRLQADLLNKGILIRSCGNFEGLGDQYCRLAVRPENEIKELINALADRNNSHTPILPYSHTPIMVVGTMSNSGKSVVVAGLCRYFHSKGLSVAPFKAQNMALNSFVTKEGGEMGRAQVVQAMAAGIEPHTDMNPVLLKPMGQAGSQVIVNGKPIGNFPAKDYYAMKASIRQSAHEAFDRLLEQYQVIILEGAGSPAEINLMDEDFVNMAMAEYSKASVILVADIDRGGVFASIYGTISLLPDNHRQLIKGIIINKFRGDQSLLDSGIRQIEDLVGIPVIGVIPYLHNLRIEDEDSLGLDDRPVESNALIDIAVVRLPHISNYTDYLALENTSGVSVRYVADPENAGNPDLIIIPGTKNTRSDLNHLHESGWTELITKSASNNIPVIGICGGFQMLGSRVSDPTGVEGEPGEEIGLNLMSLVTILEPRKELAQVEGSTGKTLPFCTANTKFKGYEIHAGRTTCATNLNTPLNITSRNSENANEAVGAVSDSGLVFGCYIHGFFDDHLIRKQLLNWLCKQKNIPTSDWDVLESDSNAEVDRFTETLIKHVDMNKIESFTHINTI